ncbi:MAG TPA: hypothetical protein PKX38_10525 [Alphaproteobacteria bacterium]|nr:hypothetical protein [Alphaproteobacteria bacterium]
MAKKSGDLTKAFGCIGKATVSMDDKGRILIPPGHNQPGEEVRGFVVTTQSEAPCILLFPPSEIRKMTNEEKQSRLLFSTFAPMEKDNRLCIPVEFRKAFLGPTIPQPCELVLAGFGHHFELWTLEEWAKVEPGLKKRHDEALEELRRDNI